MFLRPAKSRGEGTHAWTDAAASAFDFDPRRLRRSLARGTRDRLARRRRRDASLDLRRGRDAGEKAGQRARRAWPETRRPGRDARLEHLSSPRALLWRRLLGAGAAYGQPAPVPRAVAVHHPSRRGRLRVLRPGLRAAGRGTGAAPAACAGLGVAQRPRRRAPGQGRQAPRLRGSDRRGLAAIRMAGPRRERRLDPLLHFRHHRQSEGGALQPPLDGAACLRRLRGRRPRAVGARFVPRGGAALSRQRLERPVLRGDVRHEARAAGVAARPGEPLHADDRGGLHQVGRRADRMAEFPHLDRGEPRPPRPHAAQAEDGALRRLRPAAGDRREVPRPARRLPAARLGHDRDQPDRDHRRAALEARGREFAPSWSTCRSARGGRFAASN